MHPSPNRKQLSFTFFSFILAALTLIACEMRLQIPSSTNAPDIPPYEFEATGEDFLISALDEVQAIADWSDSFRNGPSARLSGNPAPGNKTILSITSTDTVYIYGQIIPGGYGAVVTERYARPKGLLLITVRKTYGKANGHIVTESKRYASYADHLSDNPQQKTVTEMYGTQTDTIVTHVLRNGTLQTYTFRLPVVTRVINPQDGSIRITSRYASNGKILSKVTDGDGNLVQLRSSYGQSDGSTITRTEYPDGSWSQVRTHGEADGTVTRETTSGLPSLGSGNCGPIAKPPIPGIRRHIGAEFLSAASGQVAPGNIPRPSLASGVTILGPRPPRPIVA
ncbi:MAG: hypothetical protein NTU47_02255 [Ignavibacteriales bacterium]|nr:hypothetical protein [Ignavibacteriales bacterium]